MGKMGILVFLQAYLIYMFCALFYGDMAYDQFATPEAFEDYDKVNQRAVKSAPYFMFELECYHFK